MPKRCYVSAYSGPCQARNAQKMLCFCVFRALPGPECPKDVMFLRIPGLARPGMPRKYYVSAYSGPCKARNAQKILCFCIFRALQGPECPENNVSAYSEPCKQGPECPE